MSELKKFYTLEEVAQQFGVTYQVIYRLIRMGELSAFRIGKSYRISEEDVERYMERQRDAIRQEVQMQTCALCGKVYYSAQSLTGECQVCGAPLCLNCVSLHHATHCKNHMGNTVVS